MSASRDSLVVLNRAYGLILKSLFEKKLPTHDMPGMPDEHGTGRSPQIRTHADHLAGYNHMLDSDVSVGERIPGVGRNAFLRLP